MSQMSMRTRIVVLSTNSMSKSEPVRICRRLCGPGRSASPSLFLESLTQELTVLPASAAASPSGNSQGAADSRKVAFGNGSPAQLMPPRPSSENQVLMASAAESGTVSQRRGGKDSGPFAPRASKPATVVCHEARLDPVGCHLRLEAWCFAGSAGSLLAGGHHCRR